MKINKNQLLIAITIFSLNLMLLSCEKGENETKISSHNSTESHNAGENCMNCHKSSGSGEGWFNVAGTVYDSTKLSINPNGFVKLFTQPNSEGLLKSTIEIDGKGNFYTTKSVDFSNNLYVEVINSEGDSKYMMSPISNGKCNSCHGVSTDVVWVK